MILKELPAAPRPDKLSPDPQRLSGGAAAMPLDALRDAKRLTQVQMAQLLKISQGAVSKVERRSDMFISTLRNYVRAIGGDLEIRAVFPEGDVLIDQFGETRQEHASAPRVTLAALRAQSGFRRLVSVQHARVRRVLAKSQHVRHRRQHEGRVQRLGEDIEQVSLLPGILQQAARSWLS